MKSIRTRILEIAHWHFMNYGYDKTSTREIARALKITQPAVYHYFKNKEALYYEVLLAFATEIGQNLDTIAKQPYLDLNQHLKLMSQFIQEKHPMNFNMLMQDMDTLKSHDLKTELYHVWKQNYFDPFYYVFKIHSNSLRKDLSLQQASLQFLRILSVYIKPKLDKDDAHNLSEMIDIFVRGVSDL
ncbi:TetR/AcrR family transcriptional regulator [Erysipelothrix rhusiopathiae]|uniref:TetR/AcrR family transcriptional regulator n=1 Tax=Erysipelothrix rhusiopathiae TaxID=1648 RepID=UPI000F433AC4|nr:TetR/AcrR family transcriptional regulator [Erysipelothrix rhusiopathiae]AYV34052.1 TetR/AcrR family transcriptional regulator [Erysipelothrix rhusiopathiae]MDE8082643.1 TetR/AcrR family transcriptional regulator [Erysipelothrix rhusiopathiae]MDE8313835.1 TetR/AcrR family transcriptional regulator [Erysipelothrix rhusiopathiae]